MTDVQIQSLRADTPGTAGYLHFNNAGAALMPQPVVDAMRDHLELEFRMGGYEAAAATRDSWRDFYVAVARLFHTQPENIAFTTSATDSFNKALSSVPFERGDVLLTTENDYVSNQIAFLQLARRAGVQVRRAAELPEGGVDIEDMEALIRRHRPRLVAVTHIPTSSGLIQPVAAIGRICREYKCWYLVDGCQSAGQLDVRVEDIHCDFFSATFRKFLRGPRGAGFLYVSNRVLAEELAPLFLDLHSARWKANEQFEMRTDGRRFEWWERAYALMEGARVASDYATDIGMEVIENRVRKLAGRLRKELQPIDSLQILDQGEELGAIVTFHVPGWSDLALRKAYQQRRIHTSVIRLGSARLDLARKGVEWALRASPHYYNTTEEIERFTAVTREILQEKR